MNMYLYILAMALTTYLIRVLPMTIFRKPIKSRFLRSFLYYVPYCCLTAMTFPSILSSTASILSGAAALVVAVILAYRGKSLIVVALSSSAAVLIVEWALSQLYNNGVFLRFALTRGGIFVIMRREEGVVGAQRGTESTYW